MRRSNARSTTPRIKALLGGKTVVKTIVVPKKLVNIVLRSKRDVRNMRKRMSDGAGGNGRRSRAGKRRRDGRNEHEFDSDREKRAHATVAVSTRHGIVVLDFGGQYTQLIARRIREQEVFSAILPCTASMEEIRKLEPAGHCSLRRTEFGL